MTPIKEFEDKFRNEFIDGDMTLSGVYEFKDITNWISANFIAKSVLKEKVEGMERMHTHNSIPSFTDDLDEGCVECLRNSLIEALLVELNLKEE